MTHAARRPSRPLLPLAAERQPAVPQEPRLLLGAGGRLPRRQGARHGSRRDHRSRLDRRLPRVAGAPSGRADDFIIGEEVSCRLPGRRHRGAPRRLRHDRGAAPRAAAAAPQRLRGRPRCLREAGVFFALNHLLHFYRGQIPLDAYLRLLDEVPALEARNGTMLPAHNELVERICAALAGAGGRRSAMIGGSDAHTLRRIGRTWTEAPGRHARGVPRAACASGRRRTGRRARRRRRRRRRRLRRRSARYVGQPGRLRPARPRLRGRRALCLAFSLVSLPAQFLPLALVVAQQAARGARRCGRAAAAVDGVARRRPAVGIPRQRGA